jgi:hypothetical protein
MAIYNASEYQHEGAPLPLAAAWFVRDQSECAVADVTYKALRQSGTLPNVQTIVARTRNLRSLGLCYF